MKIISSIIILLLLLSSTSSASENEESLINWQPWSAKAFKQAKDENKLVIMDLEAVWCHWCHVMDAKTYRDPKVAELINKHFVAVRVDQDKQPDISNRYEDYGWPATVVFDANGGEIVKRRGYLGPQFMGWFLEAVIAEPTADAHDNKLRATVTPSKNTALNEEQKDLLNTRFEGIYDQKYKGWGRRQKFLHSDSIEYSMQRARDGSKKHERMAKDTLDATRALIDPVWGGVYQYSDEADWQSPHFEKIMKIQTDAIRLYVLAYKQWGRKTDLESALANYRYLAMLKSSEGVFYTSQDADLNDEIDGHAYFPLNDKERRKLGLPRIDKNIYARENGWIISAFTALYTATDNKKYLDEASKIGNWMIGNRSNKEGGFIHGQDAKEAKFLGDTLAMGQGFLDLFIQTKDKNWLNHASSAADFIQQKFKDEKGGFSTLTSTSENLLLTPVKHINSQIMMARFSNQLHNYTHKKAHKELINHAVQYLTSTDLTNQRRFLAGVLLADKEIN